MDAVEENGFNVTFTGGDPLYSIPQLTPLAKEVHNAGYTIWLYSGFTFEQALQLPGAMELLQYVEAMVDGPFEIGKRDISLQFRGSSNQRIIDVQASLASGQTVEMQNR